MLLFEFLSFIVKNFIMARNPDSSSFQYMMKYGVINEAKKAEFHYQSRFSPNMKENYYWTLLNETNDNDKRRGKVN